MSSNRRSALDRADVVGATLGCGRSKVVAHPHPAQRPGDDPAGVDRRRRWLESRFLVMTGSRFRKATSI